MINGIKNIEIEMKKIVTTQHPLRMSSYFVGFMSRGAE